MITNYKVQSLDFNSDINELFCEIDTRLSSLAKVKLDSVRYGSRISVNWDNFDILVRYRDILEKKANNNLCLRYYNLDDIINNIKQYLTSGVIQKFTQQTISDIDINSLSITRGDIEVTIKNNYNNLNINNDNSVYTTNTINTSTTSEDTWDDRQW